MKSNSINKANSLNSILPKMISSDYHQKPQKRNLSATYCNVDKRDMSYNLEELKESTLKRKFLRTYTALKWEI